MSNTNNAEEMIQLYEQMIQHAPSRHLLHTYRSVVAMLRLAYLIQAKTLDSTEHIVKSLEAICDSKQEIIHGLEVFCVKNGLPLPVRSDDDQPAVDRPPTKH